MRNLLSPVSSNLLHTSVDRHLLSFISRAFFFACCLANAQAHAQFLSPNTEQKVRAATFEVVIPKPAEDPIVYEKPLPLDRLPYQVRTDKYFSVGTAFALGPHQYVTAAHVLLAGVGSQLGNPALRDFAGHIHHIKQIVKFSYAEDFAVFTVDDDTSVESLEVGTRPTVNTVVYAVGNALGDGVVIRDGLYTSDTPEEREGRWKWLRFTAATSPGNSGGPLLDKDGRVVGIVRAKSENENLNYAVSIDQVTNAKDDVALLDIEEHYQLDIFNQQQTATLKKEFPLPKSFSEFSATYLKLHSAFEDQMLADLLHNNASSTFPQGEHSARLLRRIATGVFPKLIMKGEDGEWNAFEPQTITKSDLPHNGYISHGSIEHSTLMHLRRPDDVPAQQFYDDSRTFMDLVLKGVTVSRAVGPESVRVLSLSKAIRSATFIDDYGRKWQQREWPLAYNDSYLVALALPVPDGYVAIMRLVGSSGLSISLRDIQILADFVALDYDGNFAQWRDFLGNATLLPTAFSSIKIEFDYGNRFHYKSTRCEISYTDKLQSITANSELRLNFSVFNDHDKFVWDVVGIEVDGDSQSPTGFGITRNMRPAESMGDIYKSWWDKVELHRHPLDAIAYNKDDQMLIQGVPTVASTSDTASKPNILYSAMYQIEGPANADQMKAKLDGVLQGLSVSEN